MDDTVAAGPPPRGDDEVCRRFGALYTGAINDVLRFKFSVEGAQLPSCYRPLERDQRMAGRAFTIKGAPDITTEGEMEMRAEMLEALPPNSVVMWDCTGDAVTAQWGEMMTMAANRRGCRGALVNGIRDTQAILKQDFPVFHMYRTNAGMLGRFRMYHYQRPVRIGETVIEPGDWIVGDADGVIRIPQAIACDVLAAAEGVLRKEADVRRWMADGLKPTEVVARGGYF
jgi:regulator of RNase E activity RraA